MRTAGFAAVLIFMATGALAEPPAGPPAAATGAQLCTTTTTVVRRGDVAISTTSETKCEDESSSGGLSTKSIFKAPTGIVKTLIGTGGGVTATPSNVRGDWHTTEPGASRICHLFMTSQPVAAGFLVRTTDCSSDLIHVAAWTFDEDGVALHAAGGALVIRMTGNREQLRGVTGAGVALELER